MISHDGPGVRVYSFPCRDCFLERLEFNLQKNGSYGLIITLDKLMQVNYNVINPH